MANTHFGGTGDCTHFAANRPQYLEGFHARVGFGAAGARTAARPCFFLPEFFIEGGTLTFFRDKEFFFAHEVGVVITRPAHELTAIEFDDAIGHAT